VAFFSGSHADSLAPATAKSARKLQSKKSAGAIIKSPDREVSYTTVATVDRNLEAIALLAQDHECRVDRNPRKPGGETGSLLEILYGSERVLKCILSILPIPGDSRSLRMFWGVIHPLTPTTF
jgi:hypothetical protein